MIQLGSGYTDTRLDPRRDYLLKLPRGRKVGGTTIEGGHNVVIIGGWITIPQGTPRGQAFDAYRRAIYIKGATGTVHIEGVLIDASAGGESDGIVVNAPAARVEIENVRIDGLRGSFSTFHADAVQTWGGVKTLLIDHLTASSGYQGLQIDPDLGPMGSALISNVNLSQSRTGTGAHLVWLTRAATTCDSYPILLTNVYVAPAPGRSLANTVWPDAYSRLPCAVTVSGGLASFPRLPVRGRISEGAPPGGDYVPAGAVGPAYASPGYASAASARPRAELGRALSWRGRPLPAP